MTKEKPKEQTKKNTSSKTTKNKISNQFLIFLFILPYVGIPLLWLLSDNVDKSKKITLSLSSILFFTVYSNLISFDDLNLSFNNSNSNSVVQETKKTDTNTSTSNNPGSSNNVSNNATQDSSAEGALVLSDTIDALGEEEVDLWELLNDTEKFIWQTVHDNNYLVDTMYSDTNTETNITTINAVVFCENNGQVINNMQEVISSYVSASHMIEDVVLTFEDTSKNPESSDRVIVNTTIDIKGNINNNY